MQTTLPTYQADQKIELAKFYNVPSAALDLPYALWALIRDAHDSLHGARGIESVPSAHLLAAQEAARWAMVEAKRLTEQPIRMVMTLPGGIEDVQGLFATCPVELLVLSADPHEVQNAKAFGAGVLLTADHNPMAAWHKVFPSAPEAESEIETLFAQVKPQQLVGGVAVAA